MNRFKLMEQLELHEGRRERAYRDSLGNITVGVGRNLTGKGLSENEIDYLLANDIDETIANLNHYCPWWQQMTENRQLVLADMCFNMGWGQLSKFKNTLRDMEHERYAEAAARMLKSLWARQVGDRARKLAAMMEKG